MLLVVHMCLKNFAKVISLLRHAKLLAFANGLRVNDLTILPISGLMERVLQKVITLNDKQKNKAGSNDFVPAFYIV